MTELQAARCKLYMYALIGNRIGHLGRLFIAKDLRGTRTVLCT